MNIPSLTRWTALSLFVCLIAVPVVAGPLGTTFPNDPTIPIVKPVKPALPGMPDDTLPMIESRLGYMIASPILFFDNTGVLTYTAAGGVLDIDADPLAIRLNAIDPPILIFPSGGNRYVTIDAIVDNGGDLVGGVPGNDLEIFGEVTINGDTFSGMLLTGEVTGYMGEDGVGTTDFHSLRFTVTGGLLAGLYGSDIGIEITSEMSNFTGNYNVNFAGEAKGNVGVIECTGTIGDFIWLDENGNGIQDPGEPGLENVGLTLTDSDGNQTMTATDKNGFYQFTGLCAGDYTVTVDMPPPDLDPTDINAPGSNDGNDSNDPDGTPVTLTDNSSSDQTIDFGYVELLGSLGDYVWNDVNMNGVQDVDELPIEGVMVNLYACEDLNTPLGSTTTNAAGFYEFTGLAAGCYQVEFILPPDFVFSPMDQTGDGLDSDPAPTTGFTDPIFLGPGEDNPDVDAGMFVPPPVGQLGDLFWEDLNRNGIQDPGEPGIPGITVNLYDCAGNFIDSTITGAIGDYLFDMLPGGCYVVEFIPPQDCMLTLQDATNDADDSDADPNGLTTQINLADGQSDLTWDAGCYYTAGLGDFLWHDLNQNGVQDLGEPGIDGQTVTLLDENMTPTGLTTVTGPNGYYEFTGLAPGSYFVQFMAPPDFVYTGQDVGVDTLDSDANGNGKTDKIILESGEFNETIDAGVFIPNEPSISIEKSTNGEDADNPTGPFIPDGDPVLWEYVVTNDGNVPLTDVFVIDDQGVPVDCPQDTLAVGESMTCIGEGLATVDQYANLGTTCGIGPEPEFMEVCDDDPSHYFGEDPGIDIEKLTDGIDADDPNAGDAPQFEPGDTVTWTYIVSNTGNVTLTNVEVTDDQGVQVTCPLTTLAPAGEPNSTMECTASGVAEDLQNTGSTTVDGLCGSYPNRPLYENMGTATGEYADGEFVQDIDPSHYCNPPMPMIDVEKLTNGVQADDPNAGDAPQIEPGDPVEWTYLVENTGNVTLENVDVTDDQGVAVSCPQTTLDPGETMECTASGVAEDLLDTGFTTVPGKCGSFPETPLYENMGLATGETEPGDFVQDVDASHYCNPQTPDIDIEKATNGEDADLPTGPVVAVGSTVTWTYVITNTGNVPLTNVTVTDNQGVSVDCPQDTLAIGESFECTASGIAIEGQYDNVGSVVGTPPSGPPVDDFDPSHYFGALPMIDLEKLTNGEDADLPTGPVVLVGSTVTWTYIITNMGNVPLDNIVLIDSVIGPITCNEGPIPTLANNGDNFLCTVMGIATAGQYMNRGDVCGTGPLGAEVCDDDPSHYVGADPSIDIEKATNGFDADNPTGPFIETGGAVLWTYVVTNTGNVPLTNVTVTDDQGVSVDCPQDTLDLGESFECTANGIATAGQYENLGSVVGTPPVGPPVRDEDPSHYFGETPSIDIEKLTNGVDADDANAGDAPQILPGDPVVWTYIVTNTGNVPLTNVTVTDDQGVTIDCMGENMLAPAGDPAGEDTFTCTAMGTAEEQSFVATEAVPGLCGSRPGAPLYENTGTATGMSPLGAVVQDNDASHYCNPEVCALSVSKTCLIPTPPASNFTCDKPIDSLTMIYNGTQPIRIVAWKGSVGSTQLADIDDIQPGEEITVMGYAGSPNDVIWEVYAAGTDTKLGESTFHLSCSDDNMDGPEDCGLPQGDGKDDNSNLLNVWLLEGMVDASGTLDCTPPATTGVSECEFQAFPASCETIGSVDNITLVYNGGGCAASDNDQGSKFICNESSGGINSAEPVTVTLWNGDSFVVQPGESFVVPRDGSGTEVTLSNSGGSEVLNIHTSCSAPLVAGDIYGSTTLAAINGMGIGTDVIYTYEITNTSNVDIVSLLANDNKLGPIPGAPSSLLAGESVTLNASAFITDTTTNIAIVDGDTADGQMCSGTAEATVTILPPPPCEVEGAGVLDLSSDKVKWSLTNTGASTATIESIEITWPDANGDLIEIKLDGDKIHDIDLPPNSASLGPNDWINDPIKRTIPPGDTDVLEIKFDNNVVGPQDAYSITVNFEEGCSVTYENTGLPFECNTDITELSMIWDGNETIGVRAWYGNIGGTLLHEQSNITPGTEVTVGSYANSQNDVFWEILSGGTVIGESRFHLSCSDNDMNGAEDCGTRQGDGKGTNSGFVNDWLLEGMVDADGPFDCSNLP